MEPVSYPSHVRHRDPVNIAAQPCSTFQDLPWARVGKGAFPLTQFDTTNLPDDEDDDLEPDDGNNLRKQLRQSQKTNKALAAERDELLSIRKENAFLKAGLPDTPQVKFFQEHYSGDPTPEAINTAAAEFGFVPSVDQQTQAEVAAIGTQSEAATGAEMPPDQREQMMKEFAETVARGGNGEEVLRRHGHPVASDDR